MFVNEPHIVVLVQRDDLALSDLEGVQEPAVNVVFDALLFGLVSSWILFSASATGQGGAA